MEGRSDERDAAIREAMVALFEGSAARQTLRRQTTNDGLRRRLPVYDAPPANDARPMVEVDAPTEGATIDVARLADYQIRAGAAAYPPDPAWEAVRPKTYGDCQRAGWGTAERGCPWISCAHHNYLDVTEAGTIRLNHPGKSPLDLPHPCALRLAETGATGPEVGAALGVTRSRVQQIETRALALLRRVHEGEEFETPACVGGPAEDAPPGDMADVSTALKRAAAEAVRRALAALRFGSLERIARHAGVSRPVAVAALRGLRRHGHVRFRKPTWIWAGDQAAPPATEAL